MFSYEYNKEFAASYWFSYLMFVISFVHMILCLICCCLSFAFVLGFVNIWLAILSAKNEAETRRIIKEFHLLSKYFRKTIKTLTRKSRGINFRKFKAKNKIINSIQPMLFCRGDKSFTSAKFQWIFSSISRVGLLSRFSLTIFAVLFCQFARLCLICFEGKIRNW